VKIFNLLRRVFSKKTGFYSTGENCTLFTGGKSKRFIMNCKNNLLSASAVFGLVLVLSTIMISPLTAQSWTATEGETISNGIRPASDTMPFAAGEMAVRYSNQAGGQEYSFADQVDTLVTHLSKVDFVGDTPVVYVPAGDSALLAIRLDNTGNGPDTYALSGSLATYSWNTAIHLDIAGDSLLDGGDPEITEINTLQSLGDTYLILRVDIPAGVSSATGDTFVVIVQSERSSDPQPGLDVVMMRLRVDTSALSVNALNQPFGFIDTNAYTGDTRVRLNFESLANVDQMNIKYTDPLGAGGQTGFIAYSSDSIWTMNEEKGQHQFDVQYKYDDGEVSDTFSDNIILDYTPPQNVNVEIGGGVEAVADFSTTVDVYSEDSNPLRVYVSNFSDFSDSEYFSFSTTAGTETYDWNLSASGEVYIKFIDRAGNVSNVANDTVVLDIPPIGLEGDTFAGLDAKAYVTVIDSKAVGAGKVQAFVTSDRDTPSGIYIDLQEDTGGYFRGYFRFTQGRSREDMISVDPQSTVWVVYEPRNDSDSAVWIPSTAFLETVDEVRTWPSPFRPLSGEPFVFQNLPADEQMEILLYNIQGQLVRRLTVGRGIDYNPTGNIARWWGKNDRGSRVASGIYIYVVNSRYGTARGQITLVK
jgi:hypothetical protein